MWEKQGVEFLHERGAFIIETIKTCRGFTFKAIKDSSGILSIIFLPHGKEISSEERYQLLQLHKL